MRTCDSSVCQDLFSTLRAAVVSSSTKHDQETEILNSLRPVLVRDAIDGTAPFTIDRKVTTTTSFVGETFVIHQAKVEPFANSYQVTVRAKSATGSVDYVFVGRVSATAPSLFVEKAVLQPTTSINLSQS